MNTDISPGSKDIYNRIVYQAQPPSPPLTTMSSSQELFALLADVRTTNSLAIAGLTIVVIEHIATLKDEVDLAWKALRSPFSIFYIWVYVVAFLSTFRLMIQSPDSLCHPHCFMVRALLNWNGPP
ncbi:hypothetical protein B0H13DRAFT_1937542 [Mycena leptocephala]|nr:hypothetical protein B0H13DRAFT_1937542 [Mycena leptocephala]